MMAKPVIAARVPKAIDLDTGEDYAWRAPAATITSTNSTRRILQPGNGTLPILPELVLLVRGIDQKGWRILMAAANVPSSR